MSRLEELETFIAIARAGSISRAADRLHLAKSAVSRRLSDLETRLGATLLNRTTRQISLTDAGAALLRRAEAIIDDVNEAEAAARADKSILSGKLRIAAPLSFGLSHLKPVISSFIRANPELDIEVDFSDRKVNLVEEGFDVAVRIGALADSSLIARKLIDVRHVAAASPEFWKQHGKPTKPEDLEGKPCLRYLYTARPDILEYWAPGGKRGSVSPQVRMFASNGEFIAALASEHCGFVVEPLFILAPHLKSGSLETVLEDYAWANMSLYVVTPPTRRISARVRAFSDAVAAQFKGAGADWI